MAIQRETLFQRLGIKTADEIQADRRDRQAAFMRSQQDPYSKAGAAIGLGLGRLFSKPSEEELKAERVEELMNDAMQAEGGEIAKTAAMANLFREQGMPSEAAVMLERLQELKDAEVKRRNDATAEDTRYKRVINKQRVVKLGTDEFGKAITEKINVPHVIDLRTNKVTPLFGDIPAPNNDTDTEGSVTTQLDPDLSPRDRAVERLKAELSAIPEGQTRKISTGRFYKMVNGQPIEVNREDMPAPASEEQLNIGGA